MTAPESGRWDPISCMNEKLSPISGRSDLDGQWGDPRIETIWGFRDETQILKDVRHPARFDLQNPLAADRLPCEHYRWATV